MAPSYWPDQLCFEQVVSRRRASKTLLSGTERRHHTTALLLGEERQGRKLPLRMGVSANCFLPLRWTLEAVENGYLPHLDYVRLICRYLGGTGEGF